ncbi:hypothetical protein GIB67_027005 [Kingdonia uniflora]|uniref:Serpin domain-containing protein n=1 Tax=Kingdonia uniflora TaxID=39325 RepID=A0A7J7P1V5_9MAGN|nr:hypothetical protein GIB67_027005 [Kingdonia uniflora]
MWKKPFDKSITNDSNIYLIDRSTVNIPFMTDTKTQFIYSSASCKVIRLPYVQGKYSDEIGFSMNIFLPHEKDGLWDLVDKVSADLEFMTKHIENAKEVKTGEFKIPKFKILFGFDSADALENGGLNLPFSPEAGLDGIVMDKVIYYGYLLTIDISAFTTLAPTDLIPSVMPDNKSGLSSQHNDNLKNNEKYVTSPPGKTNVAVVVVDHSLCQQRLLVFLPIIRIFMLQSFDFAG